MLDYTVDGSPVHVTFNNGLGDNTSVRFNDGLQTITAKRFINCSSIESLTIPSTVTEVGMEAFSGCRNLREVTINEGLQKISSHSFCECSSLESITVPSTVAVIGDSSFNSCRNLREVTLNNGLEEIGARAFFHCESLEWIRIPSTVNEIGNSAFYCCINLREVEMNGVGQYIKSDIFRNCLSLEKIVFPSISYRLENIIQTSHWEDLEDKLNEVRGVVQWESDKLFVSRAMHHNWDDIRRDLGRITRLVSYYELKEATTTFELALWKFQLDQADTSNNTNRSAYRMDVPGPVKDTMLQYVCAD